MAEELKISFLTEAISDAQEISRFIETKTGIAITIVGGFIVAIYSDTENVIKYFKYYDVWFFVPFILFSATLIFSLILITLIIKPVSNPAENIDFTNSSIPTLRFFLAPNTNTRLFPFQGKKKKHKLSVTHSIYFGEIDKADSKQIINSLTSELLKVSFIRNIKSDRFKVLLWILLIAAILFFITFFIYNIETEKALSITKILESPHSPCIIHNEKY